MNANQKDYVVEDLKKRDEASQNENHKLVTHTRFSKLNAVLKPLKLTCTTIIFNTDSKCVVVVPQRC